MVSFLTFLQVSVRVALGSGKSILLSLNSVLLTVSQIVWYAVLSRNAALASLILLFTRENVWVVRIISWLMIVKMATVQTKVLIIHLTMTKTHRVAKGITPYTKSRWVLPLKTKLSQFWTKYRPVEDYFVKFLVFFSTSIIYGFTFIIIDNMVTMSTVFCKLYETCSSKNGIYFQTIC